MKFWREFLRRVAELVDRQDAVAVGVILRSGPPSSETTKMGVPTYLEKLQLATVETRWNVMGGCPPWHMPVVVSARYCGHPQLGTCPLNLLTKVTDLTLESLPRKRIFH